VRRLPTGWARPELVLAGPLPAGRILEASSDGRSIVLIAGREVRFYAPTYTGGPPAWWAPIDVSALLPAGAIRRAILADLVPSQTGEELAVLGDRAVSIGIADLRVDPPQFRNVAFATTPCPGVADAVEAIAVAEIGLVLTRPELLTGCRSGHVDAWGHVTTQMQRIGTGADTGAPSAVTGVAGTVVIAAGGTAAGEILVAHGDADDVALLRFDPATLAMTALTTASFVADVAQRDPLTGAPTATMSALPPWSGIEQHASPGPICLFDDTFRLAPEDVTCADQGLATGETDDIDGPDTRSGTPDIGADER
jgi:hypothetical protein